MHKTLISSIQTQHFVYNIYNRNATLKSFTIHAKLNAAYSKTKVYIVIHLKRYRSLYTSLLQGK